MTNKKWVNNIFKKNLNIDISYIYIWTDILACRYLVFWYVDYRDTEVGNIFGIPSRCYTASSTRFLSYRRRLLATSLPFIRCYGFPELFSIIAGCLPLALFLSTCCFRHFLRFARYFLHRRFLLMASSVVTSSSLVSRFIFSWRPIGNNVWPIFHLSSLLQSPGRHSICVTSLHSFP